MINNTSHGKNNISVSNNNFTLGQPNSSAIALNSNEDNKTNIIHEGEPKKNQNLNEKEIHYLFVAIRWFFLTEDITVKLRTKLEKNLKKIDTILFVLYFIGFVTNFVQDLMYFKFETRRTETTVSTIVKGEPTTAIQIIRSVTSLTTLMIFFILPFRIKLRKYLSIIKGKIPLRDDRCDFHQPIRILAIIILCIITVLHVPPFFDGFFITIKTTDEPPKNVRVDVIFFLNFLITLRWLLAIAYFSRYSGFSDDRADKICEESNVKQDFFFALKSQLKDQPFYSIAFLFIISMVIFGYMLRNTELAFMQDIPSHNFQDWSTMLNGFWCISASFFSIGFGDFYPQTIFGRIVLCCAVLWGVFLVGLLVIHMTAFLRFTPTENKIFEEAKEEFKLEEKKREAMKMIYLFFKVGNVLDDDEALGMKMLDGLFKQIAKFKKLRQTIVEDKDKTQIEKLLDNLGVSINKDIEIVISRTQKEIENASKR